MESSFLSKAVDLIKQAIESNGIDLGALSNEISDQGNQETQEQTDRAPSTFVSEVLSKYHDKAEEIPDLGFIENQPSVVVNDDSNSQQENEGQVNPNDLKSAVEKERLEEDYKWVDPQHFEWNGQQEYFADPNLIDLNMYLSGPLSTDIPGHYEEDPSKAATSRDTRALEKPTDESEKTTKTKAEAVTNEAFGQGDYVYMDDPLYQSSMENIQDMDPYERSGIPKTSYVLNTFMPDIVSTGTSSQAVNDAYEYIFNSHPEWDNVQRDKNFVNDVVSRSRDKVEETPGLSFVENPDYDPTSNRGMVKPINWQSKTQFSVDDGRHENRTAPYMKGKQYIEYLNMGLGNRDPKTVDPDSVYSKYEEEQRYGFRPYLPTEEDWLSYSQAARENVVSNFFSDLSTHGVENFAPRSFDFGDGKKYNANEFLDYATPWQKRVKDQMGSVEELAAPTSDMSTPMKYDGVVYIDKNTGDQKKYTLDQWDNRQIVEDGSGGFDVVLGKDSYHFNNDDDANTSFSTSFDLAKDGEDPDFWMDLEPYEVAGDTIRPDKAWNMIEEARNGGPGVSVDNGPLGIGKRSPDSIITKDGELAFNPGGILDIVPYGMNLLTQSAPLFFTPTAAARAIADSPTAFRGIQPGHLNNRTGEYTQLSDDNTVEQIVSSGLANLALPATERLWGSLGGNAIGKMLNKSGIDNKLTKILGAEADETVKPILRYLSGTAGEGAEEIPGNIVEEFANGYGPSEFYANSTGEYDNSGHEIRDTSTTPNQRVTNFLRDIPEAMLGGITLGGGLGTIRLPKYGRQYREAQERLKPGYSEDITPQLTDEEIEYYNR